MKVRVFAFAAAALMAAASNVSAQGFASRATGLAASNYTIDFNNLAVNSTPGVINDVDFGNAFWIVGGVGCGGGSFATQALHNFNCSNGGIHNPIDIFFTSPVNGVAFNIITNPSSTVFTAFLNGNVVAMLGGNTSTATPALWYGFENMSLDRIQISESHVNGALGIDNVQVSIAPEPSAVALMFAGLAALGLVARRRKQS